MNRALKTAAFAAALLVPALSFAQAPNVSLTRAQVRAELAQIEKAGYKPTGHDNKYPSDLQAAEARIAAGTPGTDHAPAPGRLAPTTAPDE